MGKKPGKDKPSASAAPHQRRPNNGGKNGGLGKNGIPAASTVATPITPTAPYSEIPLFLAITLSPLVVGSVVVTGLKPGDMTLFTLAAFGTFCSHFGGKAFYELMSLRGLRIPGVATSSVEELKRGINKQSVEAEREVRQLKLKLLGCLLGIFSILGIVVLNTRSIGGTLLFAVAFFLLFVRRAEAPSAARSVVLHACLTILVMMVLGAVGVFCQALSLHLQTFVLGLVPGSLLAAAVVAQNTEFFDPAYWTRSRSLGTVPSVPKLGTEGTVPSKQLRPGRLTQLFTMLLISGPLVIFVLTPAQVLPPPLMLGVLPVVWTPKLASAFSSGSVPDKAIALATAKIAAVGSVCMLIAGYLAAN